MAARSVRDVGDALAILRSRGVRSLTTDSRKARADIAFLAYPGYAPKCPHQSRRPETSPTAHAPRRGQRPQWANLCAQPSPHYTPNI